MISGLDLGDNAGAALLTRGLAETVRLAVAIGGRAETLFGLAGVGDMALTCAGPHSRNFALGLALGQGKPPQASLLKAAIQRRVISAVRLPLVLICPSLLLSPGCSRRCPDHN